MSEPRVLGGYVRHSAAIFGILMAGTILAIGSMYVGGPLGGRSALVFPALAIWAVGFFMGKDYAETKARNSSDEPSGGGGR